MCGTISEGWGFLNPVWGFDDIQMNMNPPLLPPQKNKQKKKQQLPHTQREGRETERKEISLRDKHIKLHRLNYSRTTQPSNPAWTLPTVQSIPRLVRENFRFNFSCPETNRSEFCNPTEKMQSFFPLVVQKQAKKKTGPPAQTKAPLPVAEQAVAQQRNVSSACSQWQDRKRQRGGCRWGYIPLSGRLTDWFVVQAKQAESGSLSAETEGFPTADLESAGSQGVTPPPRTRRATSGFNHPENIKENLLKVVVHVNNSQLLPRPISS